MAVSVKFVICLHSHQPVGNLDYVFEAIYRESYAPFLEVLEGKPDIPVSLHYSGPLLEWLDTHHPDYLDRIAAMAKAGQAEVMGGAFFEPILSLLPSCDRVDQIRRMRQYAAERLKTRACGFWLAERVWEQSLVKDLDDAGVDFTLVDHTHFNYAGFEGVPTGYYTAEDRGHTVSLFPINETLRYMIPFAQPQKVIDYLATFRDRPADEAIVVYADDGEKFGSWPGTSDLVYKQKWLERFLDLLLENRDWLTVTTFSPLLKEHRSLGLAYLPDASYREMMTWALEPGQQRRMENLREELEERPADALFVRGGSYRNFRKKYPESFHMYARMLDFSRRAETEAERLFLHRSQCNCAYWHGVFGGIYLPHLRNAVYENIIAGEKERNLEPEWDIRDLDMDGQGEVVLNLDTMKLVVDPDRGGRLLSWDLKGPCTNIQSTFTRRPEAYHRYVLEPVDKADMKSVHDVPVLKEPGLDKLLVYDRYERLSLLEHRLKTIPGLKDLDAGMPDTDLNFVNRMMDHQLQKDRIDLRDRTFGIHKSIRPDGNGFEVTWQADTGSGFPFLAVEWNLFTLSPDAPDKGFFSDGGFLGHAGLKLCHRTAGLSFRDEYRKFKIHWQFPEEITVIHSPVYTVNLSESGIEKVFQNSALLMVLPMPVESAVSIRVQYSQIN